MHMANELLTPGVAVGLMGAAGALLAGASWRSRAGLDASAVPMMGVMGAFVFAAQMINFPILPGTSGHLTGGVLLAILLGPHAAVLVMAAILMIQCLIFQDGGLLALGANVINLGAIPCYIGFGCFRLIAGRRPGARRLYAGVFAAVLTGMVLGAAAVPVEVAASGLIAIPMRKFLVLMIAPHLLVGLVEAVITFLVLGYLVKVRPEALRTVTIASSRAESLRLEPRLVAGSVLVAALLLGGVVSLWASGAPDALEAVVGSDAEGDAPVVRTNTDTTVEGVTAFQHRIAPLPDYEWVSFSGVVGTLVTLVLVWIVGRVVRKRSDAATSTGGS